MGPDIMCKQKFAGIPKFQKTRNQEAIPFISMPEYCRSNMPLRFKVAGEKAGRNHWKPTLLSPGEMNDRKQT